MGSFGYTTSSSGSYTTDPSELASRFSNEDGMSFMDSIFTEPSEESREQIEKVQVIMESLPPREADFVELYYFKGLKQTDIATIFKVSQPTVCYRLQRATDRIQFLLQLPDIDEDEMLASLENFLGDPLNVQIMMLMFRTTCQSEVASLLGVSQGLVRHRFIKYIREMSLDTEMAPYAELFRLIAANLNILREVRRSSKDGDTFHAID